MIYRVRGTAQRPPQHSYDVKRLPELRQTARTFFIVSHQSPSGQRDRHISDRFCEFNVTRTGAQAKPATTGLTQYHASQPLAFRRPVNSLGEILVRYSRLVDVARNVAHDGMNRQAVVLMIHYLTFNERIISHTRNVHHRPPGFHGARGKELNSSNKCVGIAYSTAPSLRKSSIGSMSFSLNHRDGTVTRNP